MLWALYSYYKWWGGRGGGRGDAIGRGWLIYTKVWVWGQGWLSSYRSSCCLTFSVPLFRCQEHDGWCVCFFAFFVSGPFNWELLVQKNLCLFSKTILKVSYLTIILQITLEKGECVDFNHSLGCVYSTLYIRLLGQVYYFSLLICYPCWFIALISITV